MSEIPVYLLLSLPLIGAYAMFAVGIVVMYRASRVLNLAQGAMAMVPAYVCYQMSSSGVPIPLAALVGIGAGALLGLGVDRIFLARLRDAGQTAQTVGTVAVLSLLIAVAAKVWGTTPLKAPGLFPEGRFAVGFSFIRWGELGLFFTSIAVAGLLFVFFARTDIGLGMRGSAENRRAASLMGINPDRMSALAMMIGGGLAGLGGILLAAVSQLHPYTLSLQVLPAFVAALIGGLESLPGALVGAALVGTVEGMVPAFSLVPGLKNFAGQVGAPQLVLTVFALVVMATRGARFSAGDVRSQALATAAEEAPRPRPRRRRPWMLIPLAALLVAPMLGLPYSILGDINRASFFVIITTSLVLLTGWVGQISLAHASFVGISAFVVALVVRGIGLPFPLVVPVGAAVAAGAAVVLGTVALRVRGLYLAVATLIFAWMADQYLFNSPWLVGVGGSSTIEVPVIGRRGAIPSFDFASTRTFVYAGIAAAALCVVAAANVRDSKTGRAFFAIRGSETAAASLGIDVTRYKLIAFAVSGALAGVAGTVTLVDLRTIVPAQFGFTVSLFFLSLAVVGGLTSLGGGVAASLLFAALFEIFFRVQALNGWFDVVSAGLLTAVLIGYRGGLAAVPRSLDRVRARLAGAGALGRLLAPRGAESEPELADGGTIDLVAAGTAPAPGGNGSRPAVARATEPGVPRAERVPVLEAEAVTVVFGGLVAADEVALRVHEGEIVGLIGPNGAGKTTVFNAISGLNVPSRGIVRLRGRDVTVMAVHERARLGLGRTFQVIQLFPTLPVFDNLLVATHMQNPTGLASHVLLSERSARAERDARARVDEAIDLLGLRDVAGRRVGGLPFGMLRLVELARALVTRPTFLMLDEPASGLDSAESERLARFLVEIRERFGVSMLLIEHDVPLVTSISDYVYVLERGRLLAEGEPADVARNPAVIAAYLGEPVDSIAAPALAHA